MKSATKKLSTKEIESFRQQLLAMKHDVLETIEEMENEALRNGRRSDQDEAGFEPMDSGDEGAHNYDQEMSLSLAESEKKILREINRALEKIKDGTYGICEETQQPIKKKRLQAIPYARYCAEYTSLQEKLTQKNRKK